MIQIQAWLEGVTPLLMNRATEEALSGATRRNTVEEPEDPRTIADRGVYRIDRQLGIPGAAIARLLREAGSAHKAKGSRKSIKYIVPAACLVLDDLCGLYLRDRRTPLVDFEVDSRPVTIPATKGRVMRHRARANEWATVVRIRLNEGIMAEAVLRHLLIEGTQQIGLGDFRPEKGGPFGTSALVAWDVISDTKPATSAQMRNAGATNLLD